MLQAPWDNRLWSLLSSAPKEVTSNVINENLTNRKQFRVKQEKTAPNEDPLLLVPPSGDWSGKYQDMPCVADQEHEVKYNITFKDDGAIEGSLSCDDGDFKIKGAYNFSTGIVAWGQFPINPRPNAKATEFYGDIYNLTSGPSRITGTFLTSSGRYCVLNLVNPLAGNVKEVLPTLLAGRTKPRRQSTASLAEKQEESDHDHYASDALPTLLGGQAFSGFSGKVQPVLGGQTIVYKGTKFVSSGGMIIG